MPENICNVHACRLLPIIQESPFERFNQAIVASSATRTLEPHKSSSAQPYKYRFRNILSKPPKIFASPRHVSNADEEVSVDIEPEWFSIAEVVVQKHIHGL